MANIYAKLCLCLVDLQVLAQTLHKHATRSAGGNITLKV